jgi:LmbE family N-acetylglucosaminyl deacetylase
MRFHLDSAEIFIPDGLPVEAGLARTTHLAIAAHQDDIEIMAAHPILECFQQQDKWFSGAVVTDGRGSPRDNFYKEYSDEDMRLVRFKEQRKAAIVGEYAAQVMLDHPSRTVKTGPSHDVVEDLAALIRIATPQMIFTHNLADKHDTHVAVALRVIAAIRSMPPASRPRKLYGCEVWRDLDWMMDADKLSLNVSDHENLQAALLGVFDSQIAGGKRYDLASMGRRRANATYSETHGVDVTSGLSYAMDMTPLIQDPGVDPASLLRDLIEHFSRDVADRLARLN